MEVEKKKIFYHSSNLDILVDESLELYYEILFDGRARKGLKVISRPITSTMFRMKKTI